MTNSYNLSLNPKIVFIHGFNNNKECFDPLMSHFRDLGLETELIILPCHGVNRKEAKDFKEALTVFDQSMKKLKGIPYYVIAFSQGALYLQLWLEKNQAHRPLKQVLLAPAFVIRKQKIIEKLFKWLPSFFVIKSLAPKPFRRYEMINAWEYRILIHGMLTYQKIKSHFKIPTLVIIDPKDELVDASRLKREIEKINPDISVHFFERTYLRKGLGCHHILFHPDFFQEKDWGNFSRKIAGFLELPNAEA